MLTDPVLRSQVEALWDKLWAGGLSNPLDAIEQLSFLLFLKRLDEREQDAERSAARRKAKFEPVFPDAKLPWAHWTQFRTPRHIIRMMVRMVGPRPGERICDPAAGTCGFLVNAYQHVLETNTRPDVLSYDENGDPHHLVGDKLSTEQHRQLQTEALTG